MKVLKFGGTSVGTAQSLKNVKEIVEAIPGEAVIVVSALGGLTDKLIATAKMASQGDKQWIEEMEGIIRRHRDIVEAVVPENKKDEVNSKLSSQLGALQRNYEGVCLLRNLPEATLDVIVSFGERMSSVIVAAMIENGKRYFSPDFIKTEKWYGKNIASGKLTAKLIAEAFSNMEPDEKAIVPGFISRDLHTMEITNLGRGGSDYTGALIAAALKGEILEIWTDVDGFMTADPRIVKDALIIPDLSFTESMELCTFGAKVIYPPTIFPVFHANIPIKILNTFNPTAPGTLITDKPDNEKYAVKGVTALKDVALISIELAAGADFNNITRRAFNILSKHAFRIIPVDNADPHLKLDFGVNATDGAEVVKRLENEFAPEINSGKMSLPQLHDNLTALAVVGKNMRSRQRLAERIRHTMQRKGIMIEASSSKSDTTLIYIINQGKSAEALPLVHSIVFPLEIIS